jgi:AAA15 family ATPase/GTPase
MKKGTTITRRNKYMKHATTIIMSPRKAPSFNLQNAKREVTQAIITQRKRNNNMKKSTTITRRNKYMKHATTTIM